jgi:Na+-translocating ferredoxin:NAD+ oxidoreductase subunit B
MKSFAPGPAPHFGYRCRKMGGTRGFAGKDCMEGDELYRALQRHLDRMPVPYPATKSGVEIRILKRLFTPDDAKLALSLSAIPEPLARVHRRKRRMTLTEVGQALDGMADRGLIQKIPGKQGPMYSKAPLAVGFYESQVNRLTPGLELDIRAYMDEAFGRAGFSRVTPQMRTVPVHKSIPIEHAVGTYDRIRDFVEASPGPFGAIPCVCRQGHDLTGEPCKQTREPHNCLMLGMAAKMMIAKGVARKVSKQEMLEFLEKADRDGLVLQPQNTQEPMYVCCCCGCCCGVLNMAKKLPKPAEFFQSDFVASLDSGKCQVCGTCIARCNMDAIAGDDGPPEIAEDRCIGCGLCVTTCPSEALTLRNKERRPPPPKDVKDLYLRMFKDRYGPLRTTAAIAGHILGRKF